MCPIPKSILYVFIHVLCFIETTIKKTKQCLVYSTIIQSIVGKIEDHKNM